MQLSSFFLWRRGAPFSILQLHVSFLNQQKEKSYLYRINGKVKSQMSFHVLKTESYA